MILYEKRRSATKRKILGLPKMFQSLSPFLFQKFVPEIDVLCFSLCVWRSGRREYLTSKPVLDVFYRFCRKIKEKFPLGFLHCASFSEKILMPFLADWNASKDLKYNQRCWRVPPLWFFHLFSWNKNINEMKVSPLWTMLFYLKFHYNVCQLFKVFPIQKVLFIK